MPLMDHPVTEVTDGGYRDHNKRHSGHYLEKIICTHIKITFFGYKFRLNNAIMKLMSA